MAAPVKIFVSSVALVCSQVVAAYPMEHGKSTVLLDGAPYQRGDEVVNHGGMTITSNGLGTWHAGLPLPADAGGSSHELIVPGLPATPSFAQPGSPDANAPDTTAETRQLSEPASWASWVPMLLFFAMPRRIRPKRTFAATP